MAVQHHLDQPLMQINEIDISPGFETQVTQVLYSESPINIWPDRRVAHPVHNHRGGQDQVHPGAEGLLL